jgi:hypothetical protein
VCAAEEVELPPSDGISPILLAGLVQAAHVLAGVLAAEVGGSAEGRTGSTDGAGPASSGASAEAAEGPPGGAAGDAAPGTGVGEPGPAATQGAGAGEPPPGAGEASAGAGEPPPGAGEASAGAGERRAGAGEPRAGARAGKPGPPGRDRRAVIDPGEAFDRAELSLWKRRGPYLELLCSPERFTEVFALFLEHGILINPCYPGPSILPRWCSKGEFEKFGKVSRMADS